MQFLLVLSKKRGITLYICNYSPYKNNTFFELCRARRARLLQYLG